MSVSSVRLHAGLVWALTALRAICGTQGVGLFDFPEILSDAPVSDFDFELVLLFLFDDGIEFLRGQILPVYLELLIICLAAIIRVSSAQ